LNKRKKDFAYPGISSKITVIIPNHTYCQNIVVANDVSTLTHLNAMYIREVKKQEINIRKNTLYLNFSFLEKSKDNTMLAISTIRNHHNCLRVRDSPKIKYPRIREIGAIN
jgi:hypothetical protein